MPQSDVHPETLCALADRDMLNCGISTEKFEKR